MRLQKFMARAGVASRRASERIIEAGRVRVDGEVVTRLGTTIDPSSQRVEVDGRPISLPVPRWIALHKPPGVLCSRGDPENRPTVYDHLPDDASALFHVGRLDFMSEGLLLLTNQGDLANALLHPSAGMSRRYEVALMGPVPAGVVARLVRGIPLDDGLAAAAEASWLAPPDSEAPCIAMTLREGRNREIRRMMEAVDVTIRTLKRVAFGPVELGALPMGEARDLTADELRRLEEVAAPRDADSRGGTS